MSPVRVVSVINVVWLLWGGHAAAQTPWVAPASRIRVSLAAPFRQLTGTAVALTADSLYFTPTQGVGPIAISQRSILGLEVSRGRRSVGRGALVGGLVGLSAGATAMAVAAIADGCLKMDWSNYSGGHCPTDATAMGMTFGATAVGAVIGSLVRPERWVRMPLGNVTASLTPTGVRVAIGF